MKQRRWHWAPAASGSSARTTRPPGTAERSGCLDRPGPGHRRVPDARHPAPPEAVCVEPPRGAGVMRSCARALQRHHHPLQADHSGPVGAAGPRGPRIGVAPARPVRRSGSATGRSTSTTRSRPTSTSGGTSSSVARTRSATGSSTRHGYLADEAGSDGSSVLHRAGSPTPDNARPDPRLALRSPATASTWVPRWPAVTRWRRSPTRRHRGVPVHRDRRGAAESAMVTELLRKRPPRPDRVGGVGASVKPTSATSTSTAGSSSASSTTTTSRCHP